MSNLSLREQSDKQINWQMVKLREILTKSSEWITIKPDEQYRQITVRLWGKGVVQRAKVSGAEIASERQFVVRRDQFILSRIDARNGAFGLIPDWLEGAVVSNDFPAFTLDTSRIIPAFLAWMSRTENFINLCRAASEGTTNRVRLQEDRFLAMEIPLPPLDEQRRIVARIDALATKIEEARGLRRGAMREVERLITAATEAIFNQGGNADTALEELLREESLNGLSHYPSDSPPGVPILRISAGTSRPDAIVNEADYKYLDVDQTEIAKYKLIPGDLLACRFNGNLAFVGRFSLYQGYLGIDHVYPDKLIRFRVDTKRVYPEFVRIAMNSPRGRTAIEAFCATTAGNIGISAGKLKTVKIPVPTLDEQRRIVAHLDELQAKADALKRLQAEVAAELEALLPAVLDQAFRGEL